MLVERPLNSDQLGKKGEKRFEEICINAGLVPNPSTWDRKGWDFIVEWPHTNWTASLDSRPAPLSCYVQTKTVWDTTDSISVRLSSVEAISKAPTPSFIYVLQVSNNLDFVAAHVLHIDDKLLSHILKRLRKAHVDGERPNDVEISLGLTRWGKSILPTGAEFRKFAEKSIGNNLDNYIHKKLRLLRTLGFEKGHLKLTTTFEGSSLDQISEALLGIGRLNVVHSEGTETRFGIPLSIPELTWESGEIEFRPKPRDKCSVTIRRIGGAQIFKAMGKMYALPSDFMPPGDIKFLIRADLINLMFFVKGKQKTVISGKFTIESEPFGATRKSPSEWNDFNSFILASQSEELDIEIKASKIKEPLSGRIQLDKASLQAPDWERAARLTSITSDIFDKAGCPGTKLLYKEIVQAERELHQLYYFMSEATKLTPLTFRSYVLQGSIPIEPREILYFSYVWLGKYALAYAAVCLLVSSLDDCELAWSADNFTLREISRIKPTEAAFKRFIKDVCARTGINDYFAPSFDLTDSQGA